jgi:hypothetical protein
MVVGSPSTVRESVGNESLWSDRGEFMSAKSLPPDDPQRISFVCDCGKKLVVNSIKSGKRLKCPSCGQVVVVPPVPAGIVPTPTSAASEPDTETGKRRLMPVLSMIVLWSVPLGVAIGGVALVRFDLKSKQQARIDAANTEVRDAVKGADDWLNQGRAKEGENVEHRLMKAVAAKNVSDKANADAVLETVRARRAELAADSVFDAAKIKLDAKAIVEAVALLHRYVAEPHATKNREAEQLLADYDRATSESAAIDTLVAMSDEQFVQFRDTGKLDDHDREIAHPNLVEVRATTLRRNLETANRRREENKVAEAKLQKSEPVAVAAAVPGGPPSGAALPGAPHAFGAPKQQTIDLQNGRVSFTNPRRPKTSHGPPPVPASETRVNDFGVSTSDGFVSLFNGRDLTGWKMHPGQPGNWRVEKGLLVGSDPGRTPARVSATPEYFEVPSFLYSERDDFADFHLRALAWVNEGGDSGVFFRSHFGPSGVPSLLPLGYEADIHDGDAGSLCTLNQDRSELTVLRRGHSEARRGEWVTLEVVAAKIYNTIKVNGATVVDFIDNDQRYTSGHIALQCWQRESQVYFHKIEIKELVGESLLAAVAQAKRADEMSHTVMSQNAADHNDQPPVKETARYIPPDKEIPKYIAEQIRVLRTVPRPVAAAEIPRVAPGQPPPRPRKIPTAQELDPDVELRRQAADNLKALGPKAIVAVRELTHAAIYDKDLVVKRKALEALGEIGSPNATNVSGPYNQAITEFARVITRSGPDYVLANAAEDSLLKLLPFVGKHLTINNAMLLLLVHELGDKRVAPAIEDAWAACGLTKKFLTDEIVRSSFVDYITGAPRKNPYPHRPFPDSYYVNVTPEGKIQLRGKPEWVLWAEAHPKEAAEMAERADAQMIENEKRLGRIKFKEVPAGPSLDEIARARRAGQRPRPDY